MSITGHAHTTHFRLRINGDTEIEYSHTDVRFFTLTCSVIPAFVGVQEQERNILKYYMKIPMITRGTTTTSAHCPPIIASQLLSI